MANDKNPTATEGCAPLPGSALVEALKEINRHIEALRKEGEVTVLPEARQKEIVSALTNPAFYMPNTVLNKSGSH